MSTVNIPSSIIELYNVPTALIKFAVSSRSECGRYVKTGRAKNTNPFLRGIAVWVILKNENTSGNIQHYRRRIAKLAALCKLKERSFQSCIAWLKKEGLIELKHGAIYLQPYRVLRKYGIDISKREKPIYYDTQQEATVADIFTAIGIKKMKENWLKYYWIKLTRNPDALTELRNHLIAYGADQERLDAEPGYFRTCHLSLLLQTYKEEEPGRSSFSLLHSYIQANPDMNVRQSTYANHFNYAHAMSFVHLKKRLVKNGLLRVKKDNIMSDYCARKDDKIFHHKWNKKTKQTIWFRCDQITINTQKFQP